MNYKMHYMCEALVDQDRYIGTDPVGYSCSHMGVVEVNHPEDQTYGWLLCNRCNEMSMNEPHRITLRGPKTWEQREEAYKQIMKRIGL